MNSLIKVFWGNFVFHFSQLWNCWVVGCSVKRKYQTIFQIGYTILIVIYCVKILHKLKSLGNIHLLSQHFYGSGVQVWLCLLLQSKCWPRLGPHMASQLGKDLLPNSCCFWQNSRLCDCMPQGFNVLLGVSWRLSSAPTDYWRFRQKVNRCCISHCLTPKPQGVAPTGTFQRGHTTLIHHKHLQCC